MHESKGLMSHLAVASCNVLKLKALGKSVESRTCPISSLTTLARDERQMHSARVYSRHYILIEKLTNNFLQIFQHFLENFFKFLYILFKISVVLMKNLPLLSTNWKISRMCFLNFVEFLLFLRNFLKFFHNFLKLKFSRIFSQNFHF